MYREVEQHLVKELARIREDGLFKDERILITPQSSHVAVSRGSEVLNLCANNYLGLSSDPRVIAAAGAALETWGYGLSSVRFICGTQQIHKDLEAAMSAFLGTEDTILYTSCFDANGGLFETVLAAEDAVVSDELNHASIIDGIRLSKAQQFRYRHADMEDLEARLKESGSCRFRLICTDGVFSMDGDIAKLDRICELADRYRALVMVDDSHATGFVGPRGRGSHEYLRSDGPGGYYHRHLRQGARRSQRRFHQREKGNHRPSAPAVSSVPVFQYGRADDRSRIAESDRTHQRVY